MNNITLTCVMGADKKLFDLNLIKHFINHYRGIGIEKFLIAINATSENDTKDAVDILTGLGVTPEVWVGDFFELSKTDRLHKLQKKVITEWTFVVDSDEFAQIDNLQLIIDKCNKYKRIAVHGKLIDRFAPSYKLNPVDPDESIWNQFPIESNINMLELIGGTDTKAFMFKTGIYMSSYGNHALYVIKPLHNMDSRQIGDQFYYPYRFNIAHFKWTSTCYERLKARIDSFAKDFENQWHKEIQIMAQNIKNGVVNLDDFKDETFRAKVNKLPKLERI